MYNKYYQQDRTQPDPPVEDIDSKWVDIEDDHDDEITFRANANPDEVVPNKQLDDTLPYISHLDNKMSVKNNKMLKGTTLSMTILYMMNIRHLTLLTNLTTRFTQ